MPEKSINAVFKHAKLGKGFVFSKNNQKRIFLPPKKALREFLCKEICNLLLEFLFFCSFFF